MMGKFRDYFVEKTYVLENWWEKLIYMLGWFFLGAIIFSASIVILAQILG